MTAAWILFRYGDPILLKYQLKATMCEALVNVEGTYPPPGFLPLWPRIADYQRTGRWDIVLTRGYFPS